MPASWVAWIWDSESYDWLSVCTHADVHELHKELIHYCDTHAIAMKLTAITGGGKPTWKLE